MPISTFARRWLLFAAWASLGCRKDPVPPPADSASPSVPDTFVATTSDAADTSVQDTSVDVFDAADASSVPAAVPMRKEDWEVSIGKWTFEDGEASCECKATSSLLYWKGARPKDFEASVETWFLTNESSAGILFRERGEDFYEDATFYQYEWYTRGSHHDKRLSLMIKNPYWVQIVTPKFPEAPLGRWIELKVRAEGDSLKTWLDGELTFEKKDATLVRAGRIGLHVFQPRKIRLRNFRLTVLDHP